MLWSHSTNLAEVVLTQYNDVFKVFEAVRARNLFIKISETLSNIHPILPETEASLFFYKSYLKFVHITIMYSNA